MELEELKQNWKKIDQRLTESEAINQRLVYELLTSRKQSSFTKIWNYELLMLLIVFGVMFLLAIKMPHLQASYMWAQPLIPHLSSFLFIIGIQFVLSLAWIIYKLFFLSKLKDSMLSIYEQTKRINLYRKFLIIEAVTSIVVLFVAYAYIGFLFAPHFKGNLIALLASVFVAVVMLCVCLLKFYLLPLIENVKQADKDLIEFMDDKKE
ncbi:MAG: hypothetical protein ACRC13_07230 [Tannerellaceae bacterium]